MTGTILNVIGIIAGGAIGLIGKKPLTMSTQKFFKVTLGLVATAVGLRLTWVSLSAPFTHGLKQLGIVVLALVLGKLTGRLLRLQKTSNRLGQFARERMASAKPDDPRRFSNGFNVCAILFCAAPLGIVGAICDGLAVPGSATGSFFPLAIKAVMDAIGGDEFCDDVRPRRSVFRRARAGLSGHDHPALFAFSPAAFAGARIDRSGERHEWTARVLCRAGHF